MHFLTELVLPPVDALDELDRQASEVAVVGSVPVPEAPCGDLRDRRRADVPVCRSRNVALAGCYAEGCVDISQPVKGICAWRHIACRCRQRRILPRGGPQAGADPQEHRHAAFAVDIGEVGDQPEPEIRGRLPQHLPAPRLRAERSARGH